MDAGPGISPLKGCEKVKTPRKLAGRITESVVISSRRLVVTSRRYRLDSDLPAQGQRRVS